MARTPLLQHLERAAAELAADRNGGWQTTRAGLLKKAGLAGLGVAGLSRLTAPARAASSTSIVVVGAGLAGLTCALPLEAGRLPSAGLRGVDRLGGRCWTRPRRLRRRPDRRARRRADRPGPHRDPPARAGARARPRQPARRREANGTELLGYFDGAPYTFDADDRRPQGDLAEDPLRPLGGELPDALQLLHRSAGASSTRCRSSTGSTSYVPGGHGSQLGQLLDVAYNIEYGAESSVQSSLNLLYLLGYRARASSASSASRTRSTTCAAATTRSPSGSPPRSRGQITHRRRAGRDRRERGRRATRSSSPRAGRPTSVTADRVVLALPFSILRARSTTRRPASTPRKLHGDPASSAWGRTPSCTSSSPSATGTRLGCNGETYSDRGYQNTWEVSRAQAGHVRDPRRLHRRQRSASSFGSGTPRAARTAVPRADRAGAAGAVGALERQGDGRLLDRATAWTKGSYSYWKVGQYTAFVGRRGAAEGNCHFAGEHTSIDFQGYLNGAVDTGERAANEILADLR